MTGRWFALAVWAATVAAALVFWTLASSESTSCFRDAIDLAPGAEAPATCDEEAGEAVEQALAERDDEAETASALEGRSALLVWMALYAATAGVAAFSAVRSLALIVGLRPPLDRRFAGLVAGAAALVLLPLVLFRLLPELASERFGPFDGLHLEQLLLLNPIIGVLALFAAVGLVAVAHVVATRPALGLGELARLGSTLGTLVGMLGAILALAVITTAARWQAIGTLPGGESVPSAVVLLWGAVFALALAALYVPAHLRWAAATQLEIAAEIERQLPEVATADGTPGYRAPELELRKELEATLGVGGPLRSLQGSVSVLAPVIAAAVSSLFA